jgi:feruloyl-CoA synthase
MVLPRHLAAPGQTDVDVTFRKGTFYLNARAPLHRFPNTFCERLIDGAKAHPQRMLVACRGPGGAWISLSYLEMVERALAIGQGLLALGLNTGRPIVILSGNDVEHLQLTLGAMFVGIPVAPLSPAWSLASPDLTQLRHAIALLDPCLVYAADASRFSIAINAVQQHDRVIVTREATHYSVAFESLVKHGSAKTARVMPSVTPDTIAKILFTSGSTGLPKAVPTTHRMLCSNQQMLLQAFPAFGREPPVVVDWLPWHHTYGGSHNLGVALYNGGTFYIDEGKPTVDDFVTTARNLRDIAPTVHFNVPRGWDMLADALADDPELGRVFFSRVSTLFSGGAVLPQAVRDKLNIVSKRYQGATLPVASGLGLTETSPACLFSYGNVEHDGYVGIPAAGCDVKLATVGDKLELRYRGPHVMRGYLFPGDGGPIRIPASETFDEESFFRSGDTAAFLDPARPHLGLRYEGRLGQDFKLDTGTFVKVAALREKVLSIVAHYVDDIVITGHNRAGIGLLVFPKIRECCKLASMPEATRMDVVIVDPGVLAHFASMLLAINLHASGSATFVQWLALMDEPLSKQHGELTDKGTANTHIVLSRRAQLIEALHAEPALKPFVIVAA